MSKVTVIVPVYNVKDYIEECVYSLINQSLKDIDIILVDDGSTDGSQDICERLGHEFLNITVIHKKNGGLSSARNAGLKIAKGEYISFIDSDDYINSETYETLVKLNNKHDYDIITMARILVYEDGEEKVVNKIDECKEFSASEFLDAVFRDDNVDMSVCDKLFRREIIKDLMFEEGYLSEDILFLEVLIPHIHKVLITGIPLYYYRQRNASITKSFNPLYIKTYKKLEEFKDFIQDNYPACLDSYIVFKYTFLCHLVLLSQTYKCNNEEGKIYLFETFKASFREIITNRLIPMRVKIQCLFLIIRLGGLYSWLKKTYQKTIKK